MCLCVITMAAPSSMLYAGSMLFLRDVIFNIAVVWYEVIMQLIKVMLL